MKTPPPPSIKNNMRKHVNRYSSLGQVDGSFYMAPLASAFGTAILLDVAHFLGDAHLAVHGPPPPHKKERKKKRVAANRPAQQHSHQSRAASPVWPKGALDLLKWSPKLSLGASLLFTSGFDCGLVASLFRMRLAQRNWFSSGP